MFSLVVSVLDAASLAYLSAISLPAMPVCPGIQIIDICFLFVLASSSWFWMRTEMSFGLFLFLMFFMALRELLRITNFVCLMVLIVSMTFRMAIASAENIEHSFGI